MTMTREELAKKVAEFGAFQPWNHNFDLGGVETRPGVQRSQAKNLVKLGRLAPLFDAIGPAEKSVLDVGCNEGFFSLHLARAGARVIGVDIDEHRIAKARFVQSVLNVPNVEFRVVDVAGSVLAGLPHVDLCLCLGVLHRVPDPFAVMAALCRQADMILFEWKALKFGPHDDAFAYFSPKPVDSKDFYGTEYWLLSIAAVERIARRLGLSHFHRVDDARERRAILVAGRTPHPIFDRPDVSVHRGRIRSMLSHSKRYARTIAGIVTGRVNA